MSPPATERPQERAQDRARGERKARTQARAREEILEAALRAFEASGYRGTKMADIAAQAGYTAASLYTYFGSKRDILEAIAARIIDELVAAFGPVAEPTKPQGGDHAERGRARAREAPSFETLEADLRPRVHRMCAWAEERRDGLAFLFKLRWSDDIEHDERSRSYELQQLARLHTHVATVFAQHGYDGVLAAELASALLGLAEQLVWRGAVTAHGPGRGAKEGLAKGAPTEAEREESARRADRMADVILFGAKGRR